MVYATTVIILQDRSERDSKPRDVTHELIMNSVLRFIALEPNTKQRNQGKLDGEVRYVQEKTVLKLNLQKLDTARPEFSVLKTEPERHSFV